MRIEIQSWTQLVSLAGILIKSTIENKRRNKPEIKNARTWQEVATDLIERLAVHFGERAICHIETDLVRQVLADRVLHVHLSEN